MTIHKLTQKTVEKLIRAGAPGKHNDGGGLYLKLGDAGRAPLWLFRYKRGGRDQARSLGPVHTLGLDQARELARHAREQLLAGRDPRRGGPGGGKSFDECAKEFLAGYRVGLAGAKSATDWEGSLARYASPVFGALPVAEVDQQLILQALEPIWQRIPKTASLVRGRIEKVLEFATVKGFRAGDNPARWSLLGAVLPSPGKVRQVRHHPALDYRELPRFVAELRQQSGVAARALEFVILTSCRTGDVIGVAGVADKPPLLWEHIDTGLWTIPKTKNGSAHLVPLNDAALAVLAQMRELRLDQTIVFPSLDRPARAMSHLAMAMVLKRMGYRGVSTVHGMRAVFKTWASEQTNFQREVIEAVLAHGVISDKLEAAYRRGDFFDKRRLLMDAWARYCSSGEQRVGKVRALRG
jgi:integrase